MKYNTEIISKLFQNNFISHVSTTIVPRSLPSPSPYRWRIRISIHSTISNFDRFCSQNL